MTLIYACIAPHAGDLIPETAEDANLVSLTRNTLLQMRERLQALAPDVVVVVNPHGFRTESGLGVAVAERAHADWSDQVKLDFEMDSQLAHAIADRATSLNVPVVRYIYGASGGPDCYSPLDWGAVVPLYFMAHHFRPQPQLVHLSPMRTLPYQMHYDFGRAIAQALEESDKRVALIASADQGHAHHAQGPYGFDPASAQYDAWMQDVIRSNQLDTLLSADADLVEAGKPDSLWPTLVLAGLLHEVPLQGQLLSYEVNVYFGILCAEFQR